MAAPIALLAKFDGSPASVTTVENLIVQSSMDVLPFFAGRFVGVRFRCDMTSGSFGGSPLEKTLRCPELSACPKGNGYINTASLVLASAIFFRVLSLLVSPAFSLALNGQKVTSTHPGIDKNCSVQIRWNLFAGSSLLRC